MNERAGNPGSRATPELRHIKRLTDMMHFCRVAPDQWEDAVLKIKAGGINIISTYVFWIVHPSRRI